ncbi:flagellar biosynthetic protein FliQ [Schlesneria sp. T3-172]|uniref:flagellar biosynthetic protein FliQ n=1 Tax=Schlesneria sphaerica TaxID=3373610 RepID=UPI0037C99C69
METESAVSLCQSMLLEVLLLGGPVLLAALGIALVIGMMQSMTQLHDHSLTFVPKVTVISLAILYLLPWGLSRLAEYATDLIRSIPQHL